MHGLSVLQHSVCMGRVWFRPKSIDDVWRIVWERTKLSRVSCWYNKRRCYQSPFFCPRRFLSLPYLLLLIIPACRLPQPYNNSTRLPMRTPSFVVGKRAARETRGCEGVEVEAAYYTFANPSDIVIYFVSACRKVIIIDRQPILGDKTIHLSEGLIAQLALPSWP